MFSLIAENWRGRPLVSRSGREPHWPYDHPGGFALEAALDKASYKQKIKISDEQMDRLQLRRDKFHGDWNYSLSPRQ